MPVNRVKQMPKSLFPGGKTSVLASLPEYDYAMNALRKGLNGECLEIIIEPKDMDDLNSGIKHPHAAFVHMLQSAIQAEKLGYVVRQRGNRRQRQAAADLRHVGLCGLSLRKEESSRSAEERSRY